MARQPGPEYTERGNQFCQPVEPYADLQSGMRQEMAPAAQPTRNGLCFEMVVEGCCVAPYFIAPEFDEAGPKHKPANQPAEQNNNGKRRRPLGKRAHVEQRAKKDGQKTGFTELDLPSVAI